MKTFLTIVTSLAFATAAVRAQTLSAYQSIINGQSPLYYNTLDNTLAPTVGTGTFSATAGATFTTDYFGNASDAVSFAASSDQLSYATGANIISGSGTLTPSGSLSLLFYTPNCPLTNTAYIFSNGDTTGLGLFAATLVNGNLNIKVANKTFSSATTPSLPTLTGGVWYYLALTWNLNGAVTGVNGVNYYLGVAGQSSFTSTGFMQKGGTGNFNQTTPFGNGGAFVLSGHQNSASGGFQSGGNPGIVDELATWNSQLTSGQVTSQFDALLPVPEPSACILFGAGGLLVLWVRRTFRA